MKDTSATTTDRRSYVATRLVRDLLARVSFAEQIRALRRMPGGESLPGSEGSGSVNLGLGLHNLQEGEHATVDRGQTAATSGGRRS